ncbi:MAG: type IV toxin-antitoxin system AbiEi family antitoxin domain-containing protein, partial [Mycobacteriales bacterium]
YVSVKLSQAIAVLGEYAADQWGLVTAAQAANAGVDTTTLTRIAAAGAITQVVRGVYQLSGASHAAFISEAAAWLRLDPATPAWERQLLDVNGGVISHRSAASIHHIGDLRAPKVEFIIPRYRRTRDASIRFHQAILDDADVTVVDDLLPVTTVEQTLADLFAEHLDGGHAADLLTDAFANHRVNRDDLARRLAPYAARYGAPPGDGIALIEDLTSRVVDVPLVGRHHDDLAFAPALPATPLPNAIKTTEIAELLIRWEKIAPQLVEAEAIATRLHALTSQNTEKSSA